MNRANLGNTSTGGNKEPTNVAFAGTATVLNMNASDDEDMIEISETAEAWPSTSMKVEVETSHHKSHAQCFTVQCVSNKGVPQISLRLTPQLRRHRFVTHMKHHLNPQGSHTEPQYPQTQQGSTEIVMFASHGPYGIVDLGASQTVIGEQHVQELVKHLPQSIQDRIQRVPCSTIFRFGNSSTVSCQYALLVPMAKWLVKICVVKTQTPFLISNNVFRKLGAIIDTEKETVTFSKLGISVNLTLSEKKLYLLNFCELMSRSQRTTQPQETAAILNVCSQEGAKVRTEVLQNSSSKVTESEVSHDAKPSPSSNTRPSDPERSVSDHVATFSGREISECHHSREHGRVPDDVVRPTGQSEDQLWRSQVEPEVHRCSPERSQICPVVLQEVRRQPEADASPISEVHRHVNGTSGTDPRGAPVPIVSSEDHIIQGHGEEASVPRRSREPTQLVRARGESTMDRRGGTSGCGSSSTREHGSPEHQDRDPGIEHADDSASTPRTDANDATNVAGIRPETMNHDVLADLCDVLGMHMCQNSDTQVHDPLYFSQKTEYPNWVYEEMHQYFQSRNPNMHPQQMKEYLGKSRIDVLEVYCSQESQLTHQCGRLGLIAVRFGLSQGDLATFHGRCRLYDVLWNMRPRHIWTSPKCGPWSSWNRLNACKSLQLEAQIAADRQSENVHLLLCDALFRFQVERDSQTHFHLEQPQGSELAHQREMQRILENTIRALCDMCVAGELRHPDSQRLLRKRTQVLTTSQIMCRMLEQYQCVGNTSVSQFSELYTAMFGKRLGKAMMCSIQVRETSLGMSRSHVHHDILAADQEHPEAPDAKRRRLTGKVTVDDATGNPVTNHDALLNQAIQLAEQSAPRVGKVTIQDGPLFDLTQQLFPDKQLVVIDVCRGVNRKRLCPIKEKGLAPYRRAFGKLRSDLSPFCEDAWEHWETLSHRQQQRDGTHARIMVTAFATLKRQNSSESSSSSKRICDRINTDDSQMPNQVPAVIPNTTSNSTSITEPTQNPQSELDKTLQKTTSFQDHGPLFKSLDTHVQSQVRKIHQNLGHPDPRVLMSALKRYMDGRSHMSRLAPISSAQSA